MRMSVVQMKTQGKTADNIVSGRRLIKDAAVPAPETVVLPEYFARFTGSRHELYLRNEYAARAIVVGTPNP